MNGSFWLGVAVGAGALFAYNRYVKNVPSNKA